MTSRVHIPTERREGRSYESPRVLYIGRGWHMGGYNYATSEWRNPFRVKVYGRERAVAMYREHILNSPELLARLPELRGRVLGCWCKPDEVCHGDVLIELLEKRGES